MDMEEVCHFHVLYMYVQFLYQGELHPTRIGNLVNTAELIYMEAIVFIH